MHTVLYIVIEHLYLVESNQKYSYMKIFKGVELYVT